MSYYDKLGVGKNASKEEIKKAFRKKAGETHPDKGGNKEEFQAVQRAYSVLKDEQARQRYDETGQENSPQSREARILAQLVEGFMQIIEAVDVSRVDLVKEMRRKIEGTIEANHALEKQYHRKITCYENAKKRILRRDKEENIFTRALDTQIQQQKVSIRNVHDQIEDLKAMDGIVKLYYCEPPPKEDSRSITEVEASIIDTLTRAGVRPKRGF